MSRKKEKKLGKWPDKEPETMPDATPDHRQDKKISKAAIILAIAGLGCAAIIGIYFLNVFPSSPAQGTGSNTVTVYYFYGTGCPHCDNVRPYIESLREKYPEVNFQILEVWNDKTNNALYKLMNHKLNQQQVMVPEVIVGDVVLIGDVEIPARLEGAILDQKRNLTASL
jgi:thiol-disulfide isomerase/thioredoxin